MSDYATASSALMDALRKAQMGDVTGAEQTVQFVRATWIVADSPELMVDLMIVEGICGFYSDRVDYAKDRIARALAVAKVSRRSECIYAASAWLAYLKLVDGDMRLAADVVIAGCSSRPPNVSPLAEFRCSSILAVLFEYFGASTVAAGWFAYTRAVALETNLPGTFSSVIYNMAVARINASQLAKIRSEKFEDKIELNLLLAKSASNYDDIRNIHVLDPLHYLIQAQALYLCGQVSLAIETVTKFLTKSSGVLDRFKIRGELDLLRYQISGQICPNINNIRRLQVLSSIFQSDADQAIAKHVLAEGFSILGENAVASQLRFEVDCHLHLHQDMCKSILSDFEGAGLFFFPNIDK
ncbi:MAG: hypothetical protein IV093_02540 [Rubrivivax sp.]|nr:hypothetical protein [Rubrivivax sp.]